MKSKILFMLFLFCVGGILANKKHKLKKEPKSYYITNWSKYKMPKEIETEKLKKILESLASFKRLEYCPFGRLSRCQKLPMGEIVTKVISKAVNPEDDSQSKEEKHNVKPTAVPQRGKPTKTVYDPISTETTTPNVESITDANVSDHVEAADETNDTPPPPDDHTDDTTVSDDPNTGSEAPGTETTTDPALRRGKPEFRERVHEYASRDSVIILKLKNKNPEAARYNNVGTVAKSNTNFVRTSSKISPVFLNNNPQVELQDLVII